MREMQYAGGGFTMSTEKTNNEMLEEFDSFVRSTLLEEANKLRAKKGYPTLTEDDVADIDTLSDLKKHFGDNNE